MAEAIIPSIPSAQPDPLWEATELDGQSIEDKARVAITHTLAQIRDNPVLGYEMGIGGRSFGLLTETLAELLDLPVRIVRERFVCRQAVRADPADKARLDWLEARFAEMSNTYGDLIGLARNWQRWSLREAIDEARKREGAE